jgi:hypothetical protein
VHGLHAQALAKAFQAQAVEAGGGLHLVRSFQRLGEHLGRDVLGLHRHGSPRPVVGLGRLEIFLSLFEQAS